MTKQYPSPWVAMLSLFTATGTLVCCALPALLVSLGMGAALAGLVTAVPQLVWLSQYKIAVFAFAGFMLLVAVWAQYHQRNAPCPADVAKAKACARLRKISLIITMSAVLIYLVGAFFAFAAPIFLV